jgi:hypothetical protein
MPSSLFFIFYHKYNICDVDGAHRGVTNGARILPPEVNFLTIQNEGQRRNKLHLFFMWMFTKQ